MGKRGASVKMRRRKGMCHYCGNRPGTTRDHVVPRSQIPKQGVPQWFHQMNIVKACEPCNGAKADRRSECECEQCREVWAVFWLRIRLCVPPT